MMETLLEKKIVKVDHSIGAAVVLKQLSKDSLEMKASTSSRSQVLGGSAQEAGNDRSSF